MTEILDIYDENLTWLGTKDRDEVHRDGDWHRVFHCWVLYRDAAGRDFVVMQRRSPETATFPNLLYVSAAGHYAAGEKMRDGVREVREELGLEVAFQDLIPVGRRIGIARHPQVIDHEIADVCFYRCDKSLAEYHYQPEEVSGLVVLNIDEALALFAGEVAVIRGQAVGYGSDVITVASADFVPTKDDYIFRVLILAKRYLNGEKYLVI
ncbi:MAG TPA: NUDIX domain-containing protein [Phototrophicaceae bacterium]|nr:NUDIX domain-containing protein [Phototrophicaceae bacterium]